VCEREKRVKRRRDICERERERERGR